MKRKTRSRSTAPSKAPDTGRTLKDTEFTLGDYAIVVPRGRIVDPQTLRPLPEKGQRRHIGQHWLRAFLRADVDLVHPAPENATPAKVAEPESAPPAADLTLSSEESD